MSNIENGEDHLSQRSPNSTLVMEPGIWPSQYPSLVCSQCHQRSLIQSVLPTAPYPVTPVLEHVPYPRLPMPQVTQEYPSLPEPTGTYNAAKFLPVSDSRRPTISAIYNPQVTPVTEEPRAPQTTVVLSETEGRKEKWTRKYCSRMCWMVGAFFILLVTAGVVSYQLHMQYRRTGWQTDQEWIYDHMYRD